LISDTSLIYPSLEVILVLTM